MAAPAVADKADNAFMMICTALVLLSGLARTQWGAKGALWYWSNPLLHLKLTLFFITALLMIGPTRRIARWQARLAAGGSLPPEAEISGVRKLVMIATHLVALIPLAAVFLARGFGA